ncbi:MAG: lysine--tRNA ligase [Nanoarchaeota archaeon]
MTDENRFKEERIRKLTELRESGVEAYPLKFTVTTHAQDILVKHGALKPESKTDDDVSVAGRIMTLRRMGKAAFCHIQDQSGKIQIYVRMDDVGADAWTMMGKLDLGDLIGVNGTVFSTKTGEISVYARTVTLLCKTLLPLPEKFHGLVNTEIRYRQRYLDLIMNPHVREVFIKRTVIIDTIRAVLKKEGFLEVETPTLQPIYGGASARPFETHHNSLDMKLYLRISNELYLKRLLVGGFERVFEFVKDFRNEGIDRTHNPEFTQVEWYQAYGDYTDGMRLFEKIYSESCKALYGGTSFVYQGKEINVRAPWKRARMSDLILEHAGIDVLTMSKEELLDYCEKNKIEYASASWGMLVAAVFEATCEEHLVQPIFVTHHPRETTPLCKLDTEDPRFVERFEPYINGWELGNAYSELNDPLLQRQFLEEQAAAGRAGDEEAHPMDEDFVTAIEYGMPPASGVGVGVDRMVMLLTNSQSIRDVIFFPTMRPDEKG